MSMDKEFGRDLLRLLGATEPPSRNKNFDFFDSARGRRMFAYYKTYKSLEREITESQVPLKVTIEASEHDPKRQYELRLENVAIRYRRITMIPKEVVPHFRKLIRKRA
ncbi:MAG: hypothetical protein P9M14_01595 [Candidatus Alcyoniella australis]|nr:hypothetical protein [Candidatus Alcyoniella australis]